MKKKLLLLLCIKLSYCFSHSALSNHNQLLMVIVEDEKSYQGILQCYERKNSSWEKVKSPIPVVIGKKGLANGIGLHSALPLSDKMEGDDKAPAGIFSLGPLFGFENQEALSCKMDYIKIEAHTQAIDDPFSLYYNLIVNQELTFSDWFSSEKMAETPLYKKGLVIQHNFPSCQPGRGSAIFFHIWRNGQTGTAGCTAMSEENVTFLLSWLDQRKNPALVQLPINLYRDLKEQWELPMIDQQSD